MSVVFLFGEVFGALIFPFNLSAPLFNASASVLLMAFLFRIFALINTVLDEQIFRILDRVAFLIYPLVFLIVLIGGYFAILVKLSKPDERSEQAQGEHTQGKADLGGRG